MWGSGGLAISMMLIAVLLSFTTDRGYSETLQKATSSASVAFFFTYMFIFGATANCIPCFVIVMITPTLLNNLKWKGYLIFMCTNFAFIPLVYFCYPETSNLTLEEVDHLFTAGGRHGIKELTAPSQPVQESFKAHSLGDDEKLGGSSGDRAAEHVDEIKDNKS
ncbi:hypothetical protein LTR97_007965 [Elasticomyces elasticus]|uniref:Major facilitator superfamily (MFS) profile domain-containing protein n=1 Tax=Elasticomyces elasticus TaxID=574655 RepID=A0AAN7W7S9_9PEZI|nr:hypothetical protein LTR97_007965 [Elasticomyces elasticus]